MDKLLLENLLLILKSTAEVYEHGTLESSNDNIHEVLKDGLNETLKVQHALFKKMEEQGFYNLKNVETKCVEKALNSLSN